MPRNARPAPVIADVARAAGVSVPTVSRILTGSTPVSESKRQAVMDAIRQLDYRPNSAARALVSGRRTMIGILTSNTSMYGYAETIKGIEEAARQAGYIVVITVVETADQDVVTSAIDLLLAQSIAGVAVLAYDPPGRAALRTLPTSVPAVSAGATGSENQNIPHAFLDDDEGAVRATEYLLGLGHRTVYHVAIPPSGRPSGRSVGWQRTLETAGAPVPMIQAAGWSPADGYRAGCGLAKLPGVTAVLCGNDELAIGVMRALRDAGASVPGDISVVGFDGLPLGEFISPSLTTVKQDFAALGRETFDLLLRQIDSGDATCQAATTPTLIIRESTAPPAGG